MSSVHPARLSLTAAAAALALACVHAPPLGTALSAPGAPAIASPAPTLDAAECFRTLPGPPLVAAFDVDDTTLFTTPAFLYGWGRLVPEPPRASGSTEEQLAAWRRWAETLDEGRWALFAKLVTTNGPKAEAIQRLRAAVCYGDADADMTDAGAAGARGVRILRSPYSSNKGATAPGTKGERCVIRDSDR